MRILEGIEENFRFMVLEVSKQVASALLAVERPDPERIKRIESRDDYIDNLKSVIENACFTALHDVAKPSVQEVAHIRAMHIIGNNLERIGDHATNIAENIWFLQHGESPLPEREKRDESNTVAP